MRLGRETGTARRRRWPRIAGWTVAVLALAAAALVYWRIALAEAALRAAFAAVGVEGATVAIDALSPTRIRIARLGAGRELSLAGLTIDLDPDRLRTRPVSSVAIARLSLDLTVPDGPLRRLMERREAAGRAEQPPLRPAELLDRRGFVPDLAIDSWQVRLPAERGALDLQGDLLAQGDGRGGLTATLALRGAGTAGDIRMTLDGRAFVDVGGDDASVTLKANAAEAGAAVDLTLALGGLRAAPTASVDAALRVAELGNLAPFLPPLAGLGGAVRITARTAEPLPVRLDVLPDAATLLATLRQQGKLVATLRADGLAAASLPPARLNVDAEIGPGAARASLDVESTAAAASGGAAITVADPHGTPKADFRATARLGDLSHLAPYFPALPKIAGALNAEVATTAPVEFPYAALADPAALVELLRQAARVKATLRGKARLAAQGLGASFEAALDAGPGKATLTFTADSPDAAAKGEITLAVADPLGSAKIGADTDIAVSDLGRLARFVPALAGMRGAARLRARTAAPVELGNTIPASLEEVTAILCRQGRATLALQSGGMGYARMIDGLAGSAQAAVRCAAVGDATADLDLKLAAKTVGAAQIHGRGARLTGPLRVGWRENALTLEIPKDLKISLQGIALPSIKTGPIGAIVLAAAKPALRIPLGAGQPGVPPFQVAASVEPVALTVPGKDGPPVEVKLSPARLSASGTEGGAIRATLAAERADVARGDIALGLTGIAARGTRRAAAKPIAFDASARLSTGMAGKKLVAPLDIKTSGTLAGSSIDFTATAQGPGALALTAKGRHDLTAGEGAADIALAPLRFGDGGARLADLLPGRSAYVPQSGALAATGNITWNAKGIDGTADASVEDMRIVNPDGTVSIDGLRTRLRFDRLLPPVTAPKQTLTARRIDAGVALDDLALTFALRPGASTAQPVVAIDSLQVGFAGGKISGRDITYDPSKPVNRAEVRLDGLDLEKLLAAAQVEGLSGTGLISGTIPVRMEGGAVAVDSGGLAAAGPGVLRFKSDAAKQALASGGKYVALALQALEDFRYSKLDIRIDKALVGEGSVLMQVEGHNPAVLEGHPFAINLNVSGDVDKLAGTLARLMLLPEEVVRTIVPNRR